MRLVVVRARSGWPELSRYRAVKGGGRVGWDDAARASSKTSGCVPKVACRDLSADVMDEMMVPWTMAGNAARRHCGSMAWRVSAC